MKLSKSLIQKTTFNTGSLHSKNISLFQVFSANNFHTKRQNIVASYNNSFIKRTFCSTNQAGEEEREEMETDVLIVGGGPAGLSTAIKLAQLAKEKGQELDITIVEKGEEIGSHVLSGNCFEPTALTELIPDWKEKDAPLRTKVTKDEFRLLLSDKKSFKIPHFLLPKYIDNHDNYIISLSELTRWLATQAEDLGVNLFTGFAASKPIYSQVNNEKIVEGVYTNDFGINKHGEKKDNFQAGVLIKAKQTVLAEGCRGSVSEEIMKEYNLKINNQHYGLGLKEVWEIDTSKNSNFKPGLVHHTAFWPATDTSVYAGSFMYHMEPNLIHLGFVVGLDYKNPYLNPYEEFQKLKTHPQIQKFLENGECISYGARTLNEGGFYSIPKLTFPGGLMVGCSAGMLNVAKVKGTHNAIRSGILAAENIFDALSKDEPIEQGKELKNYQKDFDNSKIIKELHETRNFQGAFSKGGLFFGLLHGFFSNLIGGREPWKFIPKGIDSQKFLPKEKCKPIEYPKKDGKFTFDILENLARSGTNHDHDQPIHLKVKNEKTPLVSLEKYAGPEERFCPAKVYEFVDDVDEKGNDKGKKLQINAQNCLHCKCCSIKMIDEYIDWTVPEGSGGPKYTIL